MSESPLFDPQRKQSVTIQGREWHFGIFGGHVNVGAFVLGGEREAGRRGEGGLF